MCLKQVSFMTSQLETRGDQQQKENFALQHNLPARKKIIGTSDILHHDVKVI